MFRHERILLCPLICVFLHGHLQAQVVNYFGTTGTLSGSTWSTNPAGPYNSTFSTNASGGVATFNNNASFTGGTIVFAGINVGANITLTSPSGTISNFANGVIIVDVGTGFTANFGAQSWTSSATAGYVKNGDGVFALAGNNYGGGFTLNAGTVIAGGINALGGTASNTLTLNGGILASNATRDFTGKYGGGINIGGNVQFGATTGLASATANLTFSNNVALGGITRTLTIGNNGSVVFSGIISNTGAVGLTFTNLGGTGRFDLTNTANTYEGTTTLLGGEVRITADGSLGAVPGSVTPNSIVLDGGKLGTLTSTATTTLNSNRGIQVSDNASSALLVNGTRTLSYDGIIADKPSTTGILTKQGSGTLVLGGVNTYTGNTTINQGILRLANGNNRLPTSTTMNFGQAASTFVGTLDLNGFNQEVAGLNSITGTNNTSARNIVTSASAATLTLSGAGNYSFSDTTPQNSGNLTGALSLVKNGSGFQQFSGDHTYTGTTTINSGVIAMNGSHLGGGTYTINGGSLQGSGNIVANVSVAGGALSPGNGPGVLYVGGNVSFSSTSTFNIDLIGTSSYDSLNVTGAFRTVTLGNSILNLNVAFSPLPGNMFFIINNDDASSIVSGTFAGLPNNGDTFTLGGYSGQISYVGDFNTDSITGGNDVVLYNLVAAIPEPGTMALMGLAGISSLHWYLRRKRKLKYELAEDVETADQT